MAITQPGQVNDAPAPVGVRSDAGTERRLVSVLFVDLVGFTTFSEARDPEEVRAMLDRYFESAADVVRRHGGAVEKFIGDAVMAVWGTPLAHEDDAERTVRSALEIVDRVTALGLDLGVDLQARAGVTTGEAVATVGAVGQGMVAGDLVNSAARIQSAAAPGTVLVGESTFRAASGAIAFEPLEPIHVKGKTEALAVWRAARVVGERGGFGRGPSPEPPFVGRDEELRAAKEALHATGREARTRLLSVSGVAGVGKSRLIWELQKYTDGLTETIYWHQGRCPSYGEGVMFWALAEMVRGRAGIAETDDAATSRDRLAACLDEFVPDQDERNWLEPRLEYLLGLGTNPSGDREEMFGAWRRFFERVAVRGTTLLVFEDLQWADPGLLDFVESVLEWSRESPILVVVLARPDLLERRPDWGSSARSAARLSLSRISDEAIRALVTGYVQGIPDDGLDRLVARAEGIPLYAVETIRMLADRGALELVGDIYLVVGAIDQALEVPETLHALVAARLDSLDEAARSLLQDASVTGLSFTPQTLAAVTGIAVDELEPRLRQLVRREFLERDSDPRSPERGQYLFVQSVIQEVAYSTLSKTNRRVKHLACASWFESRGDDELIGAIAGHYLEALRAEPGATDAEDLADRTRHWLGLAAQRAFSLGSPAQAQGFVGLAIPLAASPADRAALLEISSTAASYVGDVDRCWIDASAAFDAYGTAGDSRGQGRALWSLARLHFAGDRLEVLTTRLQEVEIKLRGELCKERALVLSALTDISNSTGLGDEGLRWSDEALAIAESMGDDATLGVAAFARTWALMNVGRHWEAQAISMAYMPLARQSGALEYARAYMGLGIIRSEDDPRQGLADFLACARLAGDAGIAMMQFVALSNAAESAIDLGEFDQAAELLESGTGLRLSLPLFTEVGRLISRGMLRAYLGDFATADTELAHAKAGLEEQTDDLQLLTWLGRVEGELALLQGDYAGGYRAARAALNIEATGSNSPRALWTGIRAAAVLHDPAQIEDLLVVTSGLRGRWVNLVRMAARCALAALAQDHDTAAGLLGDVGGQLRELGLRLDHAFAVAMAASVMPADRLPTIEIEFAREFVASLPGTAIAEFFERSWDA